jgi:hypothetical protein
MSIGGKKQSLKIYQIPNMPKVQTKLPTKSPKTIKQAPKSNKKQEPVKIKKDFSLAFTDWV